MSTTIESIAALESASKCATLPLTGAKPLNSGRARRDVDSQRHAVSQRIHATVLLAGGSALIV
jgi:hypothetical protein